MMLSASYIHDVHERPDIARMKRVYKLYRNGLFRTCHYDEAIKLLQTGEWFDKTNYLPKEEVLDYGQSTTRERICSDQSKTSSEREEPRHEQHQPDLSNSSGKEHAGQTNGPRSSGSEVKKRGRPKVVK